MGLGGFALGQPYGLEERIGNTESIFIPPEESHPYKVERAFAGLDFRHDGYTQYTILPVYLTPSPGDSGRLFAVFMGGLIRVFENHPDVAQAGIFLDISHKVNPVTESGMLGMAFHPRFRENGRFYVTYTTGEVGTDEFRNVLSEFTVSPDNPDSADPESERILLSLPHPGPFHHMAQIAFGADGFLYVGQGDGGNPSLADNPAQDRSDLFGSILRIDVDGRAPGLEYGIPPDNPLAGNDSGWREEIWAWGLRFPWRFSFDAQTGELWQGDVGHTTWEEINLILPGRNYGWPNKEGYTCHLDCPEGAFEPPLHAYDHQVGHAVIGGHVYRGKAHPQLQGTYIFGDYMNRQIWGLTRRENDEPDIRLLAVAPFLIYSFGTDAQGEIYLVGETDGIYQLAPSTEAGAGSIPETISASRLFADPAAQEPSPWVIPYSVNAPGSSEGLRQARFFSLPRRLRFWYRQEGAWDMPSQTVFVQNLYLDTVAGDTTSSRIVETRLLVRKSGSNDWNGFSYIWNREGTDARLLEKDTVAQYAVRHPRKGDSIGMEAHRFPSRNDCRTCHSPHAGFLLGFKTSQLNRDHVYGEVTDHQFRTWEHIRLFRVGPPTRDYASLPYQPNPLDTLQDLNARARSYLDANCSYCHRPGGPGRGGLDLRFSTPSTESRLFEMSQTPGTDGARRHYVLPGHPLESEIYRRMASMDSDAMPPLGKDRVDARGLDLIGRWISDMAGTLPRREADRKDFEIRVRYLDNTLELIGGSLPAPGSGEMPDFRLFDTDGRRGVKLTVSGHGAGRGQKVWRLRAPHTLSPGRYWVVFHLQGKRRALPFLVL